MIKKIITYIISIMLALEILFMLTINIFSSTILSKKYVLEKMKEQDYYEKIYNQAKSNFENYIHQSGLDEEILEDIISKDKIESDTEKIIDNIYMGKDEKIDTEEIKDKLNDNIKKSLDGKISETQQKSIDVFVDTICKEYETTLSHTGYETKINSALNLINKYINIAKKIDLAAIIITLIILCLVSLGKIYYIISSLGISLIVDGAIYVLIEKYINAKIKIDTIVLLNDGFSDVLKNILKDILLKISKNGYIMLGVGIALIIIYSIIKSIYIEKTKNEYTTEN